MKVVDVADNVASKLPAVLAWIRELCELPPDSFSSEAVTPCPWLRFRRGVFLASVSANSKLRVSCREDTYPSGARDIRMITIDHVPSSTTILAWPGETGDVRFLGREDLAESFKKAIGE